MKLPHLRKSRRLEMDIPLDGETVWPTRLRKLRKTEVAKLLFKPDHPAEKQVFTIEFDSIKRPIAIRGKKLADDEGVFIVLL